MRYIDRLQPPAPSELARKHSLSAKRVEHREQDKDTFILIINEIQDNLDLICLLMTCRSFYKEFQEKFKSTLQFKDISMVTGPPFTKERSILNHMVDRIKLRYPMKGFESLLQNALADQMIQGRTVSFKSTVTTGIPITKVYIEDADCSKKLPPPQTTKHLIIHGCTQTIFQDKDWFPPELDSLYLSNAGEQSIMVINLPGDSLTYLSLGGVFNEINIPRNVTTLVLDLLIIDFNLIHGLSGNTTVTSLKLGGIVSMNNTFQFPTNLIKLTLKESPYAKYLPHTSTPWWNSSPETTIILDNLLSLETLKLKSTNGKCLPDIKNLPRLKHLRLLCSNAHYKTSDLPASLETLKLSSSKTIDNLGEEKDGKLLPLGLKDISISDEVNFLPSTLLSHCKQLERLETDIGNADRFHFIDSIQHLKITYENDRFDNTTQHIRLPKNLVSLESCSRYPSLLLRQQQLPTTLTTLNVHRFTGLTSKVKHHTTTKQAVWTMYRPIFYHWKQCTTTKCRDIGFRVNARLFSPN
ncbi:hypothetical protein DFA_10727 [Cavenderia fasciculata]|uniref:Uncharacterized protein n=1 Tax=Cavenderia fasciculata TaxID=261658 RepID=F4QB82_CACFS|nr:uncharacterized protein DFA_10727 [Cavenderia fasciculata]EGG14854.1 hypothetical protein DFA_10727 [Cavenderia fasciculata]|eukprot:XP_004351370.1 hypothetical protein DFA_10727 [Cavenderia fasciculata]